MPRLSYGKLGQVRFSNFKEYYYTLGFLANSRNAEIRWENNEEQGAWGSEGRIHCLVPETYFPQCFKFTAGRGSIYARINCNDYIATLVREHNFSYNTRYHNVDKIMETVPNEYRSDFKMGYKDFISSNPTYKAASVSQTTKTVSKTSSTATPKTNSPTTKESAKEVPVKKGEIIKHKAFGNGTVVSYRSGYVTIKFPKHGEKSFGNPHAFVNGFLQKL